MNVIRRTLEIDTGTDARLTEMAAEHPHNEPVAAHLRALVSNFELKRYMNVLEAMRKNG